MLGSGFHPFGPKAVCLAAPSSGRPQTEWTKSGRMSGTLCRLCCRGAYCSAVNVTRDHSAAGVHSVVRGRGSLRAFREAAPHANVGCYARPPGRHHDRCEPSASARSPTSRGVPLALSGASRAAAQRRLTLRSLTLSISLVLLRHWPLVLAGPFGQTGTMRLVLGACLLELGVQSCNLQRASASEPVRKHIGVMCPSLVCGAFPCDFAVLRCVHRRHWQVGANDFLTKRQTWILAHKRKNSGFHGDGACEEVASAPPLRASDLAVGG